MKKLTLFFLFFLGFSTISHSQTYISPFYGYGYSYLIPTHIEYNVGFDFDLLGYYPNGYYLLRKKIRDFSSPIYLYKNHLKGFKINQIISKSLELDFETTLSTTKQIPFGFNGWGISVQAFGYNKYGFLIALKYYPVTNFYFSTGIGLENIKIVKKFSEGVYSYIAEFYEISNSQINYNLAVGGIYRNFFCELKFIDGFKYIEGNDPLFYPISSFYGVIGYRLKIYPKRHKKNVDCPKF